MGLLRRPNRSWPPSRRTFRSYCKGAIRGSRNLASLDPRWRWALVDRRQDIPASHRLADLRRHFLGIDALAPRADWMGRGEWRGEASPCLH